MKYQNAVEEITALREDDARIVAWEAAQPNTLTIELPRDFDLRYSPSLERITRYVASQLQSGMPEREIFRRLHGPMGVE